MSEPETIKKFINSLHLQIVALLVLLLFVPPLGLILMWFWIFRLLTKAEGWESRLWLSFGLVLFTIITLGFFGSMQEEPYSNPCTNPPNDSMTSSEWLDASIEHKECLLRWMESMD